MKLIFSILFLTQVSLSMARSIDGDTIKISSEDDEIFLPKHGVYLNTFGLFGKFRIRYEYQPIASRSYQIGLCTHYLLNLDYGTNVFFEYRQYPIPKQRHRSFYFARVAYGQVWHPTLDEDSWSGVYVENTKLGSYVSFGGGIGQQFRFGRAKNFRVEFQEGLQYANTIEGVTDFRSTYYAENPEAYNNYWGDALIDDLESKNTPNVGPFGLPFFQGIGAGSLFYINASIAFTFPGEAYEVKHQEVGGFLKFRKAKL